PALTFFPYTTLFRSLKLNLSACILKLRLEIFSLSLVNTFFNGIRCIINKLFSFFETETGYGSDLFNDGNLFVAGTIQNYIEFCLDRKSTRMNSIHVS